MSSPNFPPTIFYSEEDGGYIAVAPDLKGCPAFGETPQNAFQELQVATELRIKVARDDSKPIPEPTRIRT
jgi:predicted RNase H-like HicB family nuclease